jgi:von Willebrand factor type A C-terminal domain/von Willebrand factor type A domain
VVSTFTAEIFQNEYLSEGATEVNGIVTVTSEASGPAGGGTGVGATEIIVIDSSGSMSAYGRIAAAKEATRAAIGVLRDGVSFAVIAGSHVGTPVYPSAGLAVADARTRAEADRAVRAVRATGGTAMSTWLDAAGELFRTRPGAINHAVLLTDGRNESEEPEALEAALVRWRGTFQCDGRGIGTNWEVAELRSITSALLGTADIVAAPDQLAADFTAMVGTALGRTDADVRLRVWTPAGGTLRFLKQVAPEIADLTGAGQPVNARSADYPTGAWGAESRDYHVLVDVPAGAVGDEMLAARVSVVTAGPDGDEVRAQGLLRAVWTEEAALSTRINKAVAHYTGQAELASAIAEALEAHKAGDVETATLRFGRAAQLAAAGGNADTEALLARVVDIEDPATGKVRLKRAVSDEDEMTLDTRSTRTVRVGRRA